MRATPHHIDRSAGSDGTRAVRAMPWPALLVLLVLVLLLAPSVVAQGGEPAGPARPSEGSWSFQFIPYLWLPEVQGTIEVRGRSASIDVDFDDIFDLLGDGKLLAGMGHFEAQYDRFSFFVDAIGGTAQPSSSLTAGRRQVGVGTVDTVMNYTFIEFGPAYRVFDWAQDDTYRPIVIDLLAGGRFMYFYEAITLKGSRGRVETSADTTITWIDPFVGGRFAVPLVGDLDMIFRGDIGGFGAGSELAWNLIGGFRYELAWRLFASRTFVVLAYKAFDFDYETGSGSQGSGAELDMRGPAIGLGFAF